MYTFVAAFMDLKYRRIPNSWILTGFLIAFGQSVIIGPGLTGSLRGVFPVLPLMVLYALRAMGAGDVKLLMVTGAFLGAPALFECLFWILICALLQFAVFSVIDIFIKNKDKKLIRIRGRSHAMPLAPAVFAGVVINLLSCQVL